MGKRPTWRDVYDINPRTGALRLGTNRLDDYAQNICQRGARRR